MRMRSLLLVLLLVVLHPAAAARYEQDCQARLRLDHILNAGMDIAPRLTREAGEDAPPIQRMYDIIQHWAIAVAIGDYEGARLFGDRVLESLGLLLDEIEPRAGQGEPDAVYARLAISATMARISLVDHALLPAIRYGRIARRDAQWLLQRQPEDMRASFFLGLYEYYTGVAPAWLRTVGALAGVHGDPGKGLGLIEATVLSNNELAPEAARVLLAELRPVDRPQCRYLPLAEDLVNGYPDNFRFRWFLDRERERCENHRLAHPDSGHQGHPPDAPPPRLSTAPACQGSGGQSS